MNDDTTFPKWSDFRENEEFQSLDRDQQMKVFDSWASAKSETLDIESLSPHEAQAHQTQMDLLRRVSFSDTEVEAEDLLPEIMDSRRRSVLSKIQGTYDADIAAQRYRSFFNPEVGEETGNLYYRVGGKHINVDPALLDWMESRDMHRDHRQNYEWETRKIGDNPAEINPAVAIKGYEYFKQVVMESEMTPPERAEALANYGVYRAAASQNARDYIFGKQKTAMNNVSEFIDRNVLGLPTKFKSDFEDGEMDYDSVDLFMDDRRLRKMRKEGKIEITDKMLDEFEHLYMGKRGGGSIEPEQKEMYREFLRDIFLDEEKAWNKETVTLKDSEGKVRLNPKLMLEMDEETIRTTLKDAGASSTEVEGYVNYANRAQEEQATTIINGLLTGVRDIRNEGVMYGLYEGTMKRNTKRFRMFYDLNRDKGWSDKEMLDEYQAFVKDPGFKGMALNMAGSGQLGKIGALLQAMGSEGKDDNAFEKVGAFLRTLEEAVPQGVGKFGLGIYAMADNLITGDTEMLEMNREFDRLIADADSLYGGSAKWGRMFGEELGVMAATMGGGTLTRLGTRAAGQALQTTLVANATEAFVGKNLYRMGFAGEKLTRNVSRIKALSNSLGSKTYFTIQASRSAEATYGEAFEAYEAQAIAAGMDPEQAEEEARNRAIIPAMGAGLITGALMKAVPGGVERYFQAGSSLTMGQARASLGLTKNMWKKALANPEFRKNAQAFIVDSFYKGAREAGMEAAEEFLDELGQGVLSAMTYNPDAQFKDVIWGATQAAVVGGIMGGGVSAMPTAPGGGLDPAVRDRLLEMEKIASNMDFSPETQGVLQDAIDRANYADSNNDLDSLVEGGTYWTVTPDGNPVEAVYNKGELHYTVEGLEGEDPQTVSIPSDGARIGITKEDVTRAQEPELVITKRTEFLNEIDEAWDSEAEPKEKLKTIEGIFERAKNDPTLKGTDSLDYIQLTNRRRMEKLERETGKESHTPERLQARFGDYERPPAELLEADSENSFDAVNESRMRSREGIQSFYRENFDDSSAELLSAATDVIFGSSNLLNQSYEEAGNKQASRRLSKEITDLQNSLLDISNKLAVEKDPEAAKRLKTDLATKVTKMYNYLAPRFKKEFSGKQEWLGEKLSGDTGKQTARIKNMLVDTGELSDLQLPEFKTFTGLDKLSDSEKKKYLHNMVKRGVPKSEVESEVENETPSDVLSDEEQDNYIALVELLEEMSADTMTEGEVIDLATFMKAANDESVPGDQALVQRVWQDYVNSFSATSAYGGQVSQKDNLEDLPVENTEGEPEEEVNEQEQLAMDAYQLTLLSANEGEVFTIQDYADFVGKAYEGVSPEQVVESYVLGAGTAIQKMVENGAYENLIPQFTFNEDLLMEQLVGETETEDETEPEVEVDYEAADTLIKTLDITNPEEQADFREEFANMTLEDAYNKFSSEEGMGPEEDSTYRQELGLPPNPGPDSMTAEEMFDYTTVGEGLSIEENRSDHEVVEVPTELLLEFSEGGKRNTDGSYELTDAKFDTFTDTLETKKLSLPEVYVNNGKFSFANGWNRANYAAARGVESIPIATDNPKAIQDLITSLQSDMESKLKTATQLTADWNSMPEEAKRGIRNAMTNAGIPQAIQDRAIKLHDDLDALSRIKAEFDSTQASMEEVSSVEDDVTETVTVASDEDVNVETTKRDEYKTRGEISARIRTLKLMQVGAYPEYKAQLQEEIDLLKELEKTMPREETAAPEPTEEQLEEEAKHLRRKTITLQLVGMEPGPEKEALQKELEGLRRRPRPKFVDKAKVEESPEETPESLLNSYISNMGVTYEEAVTKLETNDFRSDKVRESFIIDLNSLIYSALADNPNVNIQPLLDNLPGVKSQTEVLKSIQKSRKLGDLMKDSVDLREGVPEDLSADLETGVDREKKKEIRKFYRENGRPPTIDEVEGVTQEQLDRVVEVSTNLGLFTAVGAAPVGPVFAVSTAEDVDRNPSRPKATTPEDIEQNVVDKAEAEGVPVEGPKTITKHKAFGSYDKGDNQGSDYKHYVELKDGWEFTEGRHEGASSGFFNTVKEFSQAKPKQKAGAEPEAKAEPTEKPKKQPIQSKAGFYGEELTAKETELESDRVTGPNKGVPVVVADFTKDGDPLRTHLTKAGDVNETVSMKRVNEKIMEEYPLVAPGETLVLRQPSTASKVTRAKIKAKVETTDQQEMLDVMNYYGRPLPETFVNHPLSMAVGLYDSANHSVKLPQYFLDNPDKINPAMVLNEDGTEVIGVKIPFQKPDGSMEVVTKDNPINVVAPKYVDSVRSERQGELSGTGGVKTPVIDAYEAWDGTKSGLSESELSWMFDNSNDRLLPKLSLPELVGYALSKREDLGSEAIGTAQNTVTADLSIAILRKRLAEDTGLTEIESDEDREQARAWFEENYVKSDDPAAQGFVAIRDRLLKDNAKKKKGDIANLYRKKIPRNGESFSTILNQRIGEANGKENLSTSEDKRYSVETVSLSDKAAATIVGSQFNYGALDGTEGAQEFVEEQSSDMMDQGTLPDFTDDHINDDMDYGFEAMDGYGGEGAYPVDADGEIDWDQMTVLAVAQLGNSETSSELRELGLKDGQGQTLRTALNRIVQMANQGKVQPQYGRVAQMLRDTLDFSKVNVAFRTLRGQYDSAAAMLVENKDGTATVVIDPEKHNGKGAHDIIVHELVHALLDDVVTNPRTEAHRKLVGAMDAYSDRAEQYLDRMEATTGSIAQWMDNIAAREATKYSLARIKRMLKKSRNPLARDFDESMDEDTVRNLFYEVRRFDHGAAHMQNEIIQTRYALGQKLDDRGRVVGEYDPTYRRSEFVAHLLTDDKFQWFLAQVDNETKGGSLLAKAFRSIMWSFDGQPKTNESAALMYDILALGKDKNSILSRRDVRQAQALRGSTPIQITEANLYRESLPVVITESDLAGAQATTRQASRFAPSEDVNNVYGGKIESSFPNGFYRQGPDARGLMETKPLTGDSPTEEIALPMLINLVEKGVNLDEATVTEHGDGIEINLTSKAEKGRPSYTLIAKLLPDAQGRMSVLNMGAMFTNDGNKSSSMDPVSMVIFDTIMESADKYGVKFLVTKASGYVDEETLEKDTGYATWPILGYESPEPINKKRLGERDGNKPSRADLKRIMELAGPEGSLFNLTSTKEGAKLWKQYGYEQELFFSTNPDGKSAQRFKEKYGPIKRRLDRQRLQSGSQVTGGDQTGAGRVPQASREFFSSRSTLPQFVNGSAQLGVTIQSGDNEIDGLTYRAKADLPDQHIVRGIIQTSLEAAYTDDARATAYKEAMRRMDPDTAQIVDEEVGGSYGELLSHMVSDSIFESYESNLDYQELRQRTLAGEFGEPMARQLTKMLNTAQAAFGYQPAFHQETSNGVGGYHGDEVLSSMAFREMGLDMHPQTFVDHKEAAHAEGLPLMTYARRYLNEAEQNDVRKYLRWMVRKVEGMADYDSEDGIAANMTLAMLKEEFATAESQFSRMFYGKDPRLKGQFTGERAEQTEGVRRDLDIPRVETGRNVVGTRLDGIKQALSVEGKLGGKLHPIRMALMGKLTKIQEDAAFHDRRIRKHLKETTGTSNLLDLLNDPDPTKRKLAENINTALGSANEDDIIDEAYPGVREKLIEDRNDQIRAASSTWRKEYARAQALMKRNAPGDAAKAAKIRERALATRRAATELINRDFHDDYRKLIVGAAKVFKVKQDQARKEILAESPELFRSVAAMRELINDLQTEVQKSGLIQASAEDSFHLRNLEIVVDASKGFYLTRSYQALDESKTWEGFLESLHPEAQRRWTEAYAVFKSELENAEADRIIANDPNRSRASALNMVRRMNLVSPDMVVEKARNFLASFIKEGAPGLAPGAVNVNVLKPRNLELKKGLRNFVGQYEDNVFNATKTVATLGSMLANSQFLDGIKTTLEKLQKEAEARGESTKFISTDDEGGKLKPFVPKKISRMGGTKSYGPLANLYGPKEVVEALNDLHPTELGKWHKAVMFFAAQTMANMTTRRLRTHSRNFIGNPMFLVNAGMPLIGLRNIIPLRSPGAVAYAKAIDKVAVNKVTHPALSVINHPFVKKMVMGEAPEIDSDAMREYLGELDEEGIAGQDVHVGTYEEMRTAMGNNDLSAPAHGFFAPGVAQGDVPRNLKQFAKGVDNTLMDFYQAGDDYWKAVAYETTYTNLAKAFGLVPDKSSTEKWGPARIREATGTLDKDGNYTGPMTDAQADAILDAFPIKTPEHEELLRTRGKRAAALKTLRGAAAYRVHKTMPNYSNTYEIVKWLKRNGATAVAAPFISFQAEIARIMWDTPKLAMEELALGKRTGNAALTRMGAKRMGGYALTLSLSSSMAILMAQGMYAVAKALTGEEDDTERSFALEDFLANPFHAEESEKMKRFVSKYFKDGTVAVLSKDTDEYVTWMDLSYMLPHSTITDPLTMVVNSLFDDQESILSAAQRAGAKFMAPYVSEQMWISALRDAQRDSDTITGQLDPNPLVRDVFGVGNELKKIVIPGTLTDWGKLYSAATQGGSSFRHGVETNFNSELKAQLLGTKIVKTNIPYQYEKNISRWATGQREATRRFTSLVHNRTTLTEDQLRDAHKQAERLHRQVFIEMRKDYLAAKYFEQTPGETDRRLDENKSGLSKEWKARVKSGIYRPWRPSDSTMKRSRAAAQAIGNPGRVEFLENVRQNTAEEYIYPDD